MKRYLEAIDGPKKWLESTTKVERTSDGKIITVKAKLWNNPNYKPKGKLQIETADVLSFVESSQKLLSDIQQPEFRVIKFAEVNNFNSRKSSTSWIFEVSDLKSNDRSSSPSVPKKDEKNSDPPKRKKSGRSKS